MHLRFFASLRMTKELVNGKRMKNELFVVILRSLPQADDEESRRIVQRTGKDSANENGI